MRLLTIVLFYGFTFISNADDISDQFIYHLGPKTPYRFAENLNDTKVDFEGISVYYSCFLFVKIIVYLKDVYPRRYGC